MRHNNKKFTLGRETAQRKALMRSLAESLVLHGSIRTTTAKAKALQTVIEPAVTSAKQGGLLGMRKVKKVLFTREAVEKMMTDIAPRFKERQGGYTRVTRIASRVNDGAEMAIIEFVK